MSEKTNGGPLVSQAQDLFSMITKPNQTFVFVMLSFLFLLALLIFFSFFLRLKSKADRLQAELAATKEEALRAALAKREFLTNMSHELRTPLNAIVGMTDLLAEAPLEREQEKYLRICRRASRSLLSIVNDLLDLSRIEVGQLALETAEFDLRRLAQSSIEMMEVRALEKGLSLTLEFSPAVPRLVRGDMNRLRKILLSLLGNAIKFTPAGSVSLRVETASAQEHASVPEGVDLLRFVVNDTGIGIAETQLSTIFDEFSQVDSSVTRAQGGSGLGLAICRRLLEAMGGSIRVQSRTGLGSEFVVLLPLERPKRLQLLRPTEAANAPTEPAAPSSVESDAVPSRSRAARVLLVEDSRDNQALVQAYVRGSGIALEIANNGREACEKLRAERYDLVLMDMQMPVMDGYSATKVIRGWEAEALVEKTPIVALTAHALTEEIKKSFDAGCDAHLAKPVRKRQLLDAIGSWTSSGYSTRG